MALSPPAHYAAAGEDWTASAQLAQFAQEFEQTQAATTITVPTASHVFYFQGFVQGVVNADLNRGIFCLPGGTTNWQAFAIVAKFFRENPEQWHRGPSDLVEISLARAFPCGK